MQTNLEPPTAEGGQLARFVDHTLLKADATASEIRKVCEEAAFYKFAGVCVNGCWIPSVAELLRRTEVKPVSVVGFPLGAMLTVSKAAEAAHVVAVGAAEVDMVINIAALKEKRHRFVHDDIAAVVKAAAGRPVKVIFECCLLSREEKVAACKLSVEAGAAFVKTSTGFGKSGAMIEDVRLMRQTVGPRVGVKAAGGVRDLATAQAMIDAGANRLGTSSGVAIVTGATAKTAY